MQNIQYGTENIIQIIGPWSCLTFRILQVFPYEFKLLSANITWVVVQLCHLLHRFSSLYHNITLFLFDKVFKQTLSIPPKMSVSDFMGYLKGKSALMIFDRNPELGEKWNREFWARGYYVATIGNVNEETVKKYIREQEEESYKECRTLK